MRIFSVVLLVAVISGCISTTDYDRLQQDVNALKRDSYETKRIMDSLAEKTTGTVKEDSIMAFRESQAEINSRLSDISMSLQELRGRFEENKYFIERSLKDSATDRDVLRAQIASIEHQIKFLRDKIAVTEGLARPSASTGEPPVAASAASGVNTGLETAKAAEPSQQPTQPGLIPELDGKTETYENAYGLFKDKKFKEARERFESFIKDYPPNTLTDNAQFWIAETYYAEKDFEGAILAYETLLKKYPDSEKTSGALLKQGFAFIEIGDRKTGKIILEKLIERFPDAKETELARKKLTTK